MKWLVMFVFAAFFINGFGLYADEKFKSLVGERVRLKGEIASPANKMTMAQVHVNQYAFEDEKPFGGFLDWVKLERKIIVQMPSMERWPDSLVGKTVQVEGKLEGIYISNQEAEGLRIALDYYAKEKNLKGDSLRKFYEREKEKIDSNDKADVVIGYQIQRYSWEFIEETKQTK